jgi:hypothetical protein
MFTHENIGLLIADSDKEIHKGLTAAHRQPVRDHTHRSGYSMVQAFATNDPRILAALKLIGYQTIGVSRVQAIERFMKL